MDKNFSFDMLRSKVFLAPMAGITDMPFRILCVEQGCGLVYTEMASAKGMYYKSEKTERIIDIDEREMPVAIQLFGSDPMIMAEIAEKLNDSPAVLLDINMGCPAPKIVKNGEGCGLMRKPKLAQRIISEVVKATKKPVTVKFRKGWDEDSINAVDFAKRVQEAGAYAVAVHGRTRNQFYSGKADWEIIRKVKEAVDIPVIGNGDVNSPETAKKLIETTACDAIMVGRAAQGNPWIFYQIKKYLEEGVIPKAPDKKEIEKTILRHFDMLIDLKGERTGVNEMRNHISHYIKGLKNAAQFRNKLFKIETPQLVKEAISEFFRFEGE